MKSMSFHNIKSPLPAWQRAFCLSLFVFAGLSVTAQAKIKFKSTKQSFGFVKKGEVVKVTFVFSNTGNEDLELLDAKAECSCTTVDFPKYIIKPNQTDTLTVYFDTKSVYDRQDRIVEVISNASNARQNIRFKGVVLK